jgi:hypothetical protein
MDGDPGVTACVGILTDCADMFKTTVMLAMVSDSSVRIYLEFIIYPFDVLSGRGECVRASGIMLQNP